MTFTKKQLALAIAAASVSVFAMAPVQAAETKAERVADEAARKTESLEAQMQQMAQQMQAMQAELSRVKSSSAKSSTETAKINELDSWMASMKSSPDASNAKDNQISVRAGFSNLDHARGNANPLTNGALLSNNNNEQGFYFGGAFDFNVNNDLFGLMDGTSFGIELGVQYDQYGRGENTVSNTYLSALTQGAATASTDDHKSLDSRLRLSVAPKVKFMHGSKLRPWLIPVGAEINVLGVPSNAVSVLNSGMQFGAGLDYEIWRGIVVGTDARYHYSTSKLDGTPTDGFTTGGYVGFKF